ncbi:hypothetical protein [Paraburkholderia sediminicola]|uniref:hypothetical protein n=1 Tax=Paraburkholderia sediminicola TaxID=458836 RepID=UPI0038BCB1E1
MNIAARLSALEQTKAGTAIQVPKTAAERAIAFTAHLRSCRSRYPHLLPADDFGWWPFENGKPNTVRDDAIEALAQAGDPLVQILLKALARKNAADGNDLL